MNFHLKDFEIPINVTRIANIHYFEFIEQYNTMDDTHNFCEIVYVDKGSINVCSEHYIGALSENQLIIHAANEHHSLKCNKSVSPDVIIIGFECDCENLKYFASTPVTLNSYLKDMLASIVNQGMVVYEPPYDIPNLPNMKKRTNYPFGADQMIKLKLEMFLISLIQTNQTHSTEQIVAHSNKKLSEVYQYINEHYHEKITLNNLCFLFGMNKTSLCKNFKNEYGVTTLNYINGLKIKEAKRLLRENKLTVSEISERLGFSSVYYFCRLFKSVTQQSPKSYINHIRSKLDM